MMLQFGHCDLCLFNVFPVDSCVFEVFFVNSGIAVCWCVLFETGSNCLVWNVCCVENDVSFLFDLSES